MLLYSNQFANGRIIGRSALTGPYLVSTDLKNLSFAT